MSHDHLDEMMADYLGGELDEADVRRFETILANDEALRTRVATLATVRDRVAGIGAATPAAVGAPMRPRTRMGVVLLRYAAVVAIAFIAGFVVRGTAPASPGTDPVVSADDVEPVDAARRATWQERFVDVYVSRPDGTGLGRTLVAIAKSSSPQD